MQSQRLLSRGPVLELPVGPGTGLPPGSRTCSHAEQSANATREMRQAQVRTLIEAHLTDPELTIEVLSGMMKLTSRYLRSLFTGGERLSHYISRRRLEECARELSNIHLSHESITVIALRWGFNNPAHFSRSFRRKYGLTPRDFRKRAHKVTDPHEGGAHAVPANHGG